MADQAIETLLSSGTQAWDGEEWDEQSAEQKLIGVCDRAALRFGALLDDDSRDEDNRFVVSLDQRLELFKLIREWIAVRRRTKIDEGHGAQTGVAAMQERIAAGRDTQAAPPQPQKRGRGRPSNAERARLAEEERQRIIDDAIAGRNDDSGLQARLRAANGSGAS